ncbi:MAG: DnaJ domain-containing protein [Opitutaceae bacterium]|nr:DnaJ domain-containing protein [Opitutaceae bacterium]
MAGYKDYYQTLGVARTATPEEIKKAFRTLAREFHPDRAPTATRKANMEAKFKEINEAYEVLGDAEKRKRYDELGANWDQPQFSRGGGHGGGPFGGGGFGGFGRGAPGGDDEDDMGGAGFSDFFEQFFGRGAGAARGGHGGPRKPKRPSGDVEADLRITLEEAVKGAHRQISYRRTDPNTGTSGIHTYNVKIPAGIREGQKIRLAGQGNGGDLFLTVRFLQHPDFRREADDLFYDLELAPWEAVLGATIPLQTLDGKVNLKIKPGTQGGQQLRLSGLGLHTEQGSRGDLHVIVRVQVPEDPAPAERELWEKLSKTSKFNPRE